MLISNSCKFLNENESFGDLSPVKPYRRYMYMYVDKMNRNTEKPIKIGPYQDHPMAFMLLVDLKRFELLGILDRISLGIVNLVTDFGASFETEKMPMFGLSPERRYLSIFKKSLLLSRHRSGKYGK